MKLYKKDKYGDKAMRFDATNSNGQGMTVVLMSMRDEGDIPGTYGYKERQAALEQAAKDAEARKKESLKETASALDAVGEPEKANKVRESL